MGDSYFSQDTVWEDACQDGQEHGWKAAQQCTPVYRVPISEWLQSGGIEGLHWPGLLPVPAARVRYGFIWIPLSLIVKQVLTTNVNNSWHLSTVCIHTTTHAAFASHNLCNLCVIGKCLWQNSCLTFKTRVCAVVKFTQLNSRKFIWKKISKQHKKKEKKRKKTIFMDFLIEYLTLCIKIDWN